VMRTPQACKCRLTVPRILSSCLFCVPLKTIHRRQTPLLFGRRSHLAQPTLSSCGKGDLIQTLPKASRTLRSHFVSSGLFICVTPLTIPVSACGDQSRSKQSKKRLGRRVFRKASFFKRISKADATEIATRSRRVRIDYRRGSGDSSSAPVWQSQSQHASACPARARRG
jgi:hypothetical protein